MKKLMTHFYYGDPNEEFSLKLARTLLESGADILEVGIPYSDPVCDGEIFQQACKRALENGMTPPKVLVGIRKLRKLGFKQQIFLTSYFAPIYKMGIEKFLREAKNAQVQGLIIPDILLEEQGELLKLSQKINIGIVQFATPYSTIERLEQIIKVARNICPFVYCMSTPGVTGVRKELNKDVKKTVKKIRMVASTPIYVGFGVSQPSHVQDLIAMGVDGVIVGSAIAKIYSRNINSPENSLGEISQLIKTLKSPIYGMTKSK